MKPITAPVAGFSGVNTGGSLSPPMLSTIRCSTAATSLWHTCSMMPHARTTPVGGFFRDVEPKRTVFQGGPGAWELVIRYSHSDFNDKTVTGGNFGRITPQVNWYLSPNVRLELNYGYGHLR